MITLRSCRLAIGVLCLTLWTSQSSEAGTATTTFQVTATVTASCTVSATDLNFGSYSTASNLDGTTTVSVTCTNGTSYQVGLNAGTGTGAVVASRKMTSGASTLTYSLYQDALRGTVWGTTQNSDTVSATGTGSAQSLTVYGRVPSGQVPSAGTYTDTITVTVYY